jgi:hypothetical protein
MCVVVCWKQDCNNLSYLLGTTVRLYIYFHNLPAVGNTNNIYEFECIAETPPIFKIRANSCRRETDAILKYVCLQRTEILVICNGNV